MEPNRETQRDPQPNSTSANENFEPPTTTSQEIQCELLSNPATKKDGEHLKTLRKEIEDLRDALKKERVEKEALTKSNLEYGRKVKDLDDENREFKRSISELKLELAKGAQPSYFNLSPILQNIASQKEEAYSLLGLPLLSIDFDGDHFLDWNTMKSCRNYRSEWCKMVQEADKSAQLYFPPLSLSLEDGSSIILILFLKRDGDNICVYGGCHEYANDQLLPLEASLKMTLLLSSNNREESTRSIQQNVKMEKNHDDGGWHELFVFADIDWNNLSSATAPRVKVSARKSNQKETYSWYGLSPVSMDFGGKHSVDWNTLKACRNYQVEWSKMAQETESNARLDFQPLSLSLPNGSSTILVLYLKKIGKNIWVFGGHYEYADKEILTQEVSLIMILFLSNKNGQQSSHSVQKKVTLERRVIPKLFVFENIDWDNVSLTKAPVAELFVCHPNRGIQLFQYSAEASRRAEVETFWGLRCILCSASGLFNVETGEQGGRVDWSGRWRKMVDGRGGWLGWCVMFPHPVDNLVVWMWLERDGDTLLIRTQYDKDHQRGNAPPQFSIDCEVSLVIGNVDGSSRTSSVRKQHKMTLVDDWLGSVSDLVTFPVQNWGVVNPQKPPTVKIQLTNVAL